MALGDLISPWIIPLLLIALLAAAAALSEAPRWQFLQALSLVLLFGIPFTYAVTLALVLPMAIILRSRNALSTVTLCLWCAFLGPVTLQLYTSLLLGRILLPDWDAIPMPALYGLLSGLGFCLISGIRLRARGEALTDSRNVHKEDADHV